MQSKVILNNVAEITPDLIKKLILKHQNEERPKINSLFNYYTNPDINKFPAYIIDRTIDYFSGTSITYSSKNTMMLSKIEKIYTNNQEQAYNQNLIKDMCIYGTAYELIYFNKNNEITLTKLPVENVISVYDKKHVLVSIIIYAMNKNKELNRTYIEVYKKDVIQFYVLENDTISLLNKMENKLKFIPINIYINESTGYGDFEKVLPYIEQYLEPSNTLNEMNKLKREIHKFSGVPDEQLKYFNIDTDKIPKKLKYKFIDLDDKCKKKERWFKNSLYNRIKYILMMCNFNPNEYNERDIQISFNKK